jgi:hypothetical protein
VRSHPGGLLYYGLAYRDLLVEHLGCSHRYLVAVGAGEIRGVLPVMWREDHGRRIYNSLPYFGSHGWILSTDGQAERALSSAWQDLAEAPTTVSATVISNPMLEAGSIPRHNFSDERINQTTALPEGVGEHGRSPEEDVLALTEPSARRNVRKALRMGVSLEAGAAGIEGRLEVLCRIHRDNMRTLGAVAKSREFFEAVPKHFRPVEDFDVYVGCVDGQPAAALLVFYYARTAEYFTPAVEHSHRSDQPLAAVLLRAMTDASKRGLRRWNWGGTGLTQEGVYRFKRKWGAIGSRYRYLVQLNDESILDRSVDELTDSFEHFYVVPFARLRSKGGTPSRERS